MATLDAQATEVQMTRPLTPFEQRLAVRRQRAARHNKVLVRLLYWLSALMIRWRKG